MTMSEGSPVWRKREEARMHGGCHYFTLFAKFVRVRICAIFLPHATRLPASTHARHA